MISSYSRRAIDIAVSTVAMPLVGFAIVAAWVCASGKNPLFMQERVGLHGELFKVLKIKTMNDNISLPPSQRITRVGKYYRAFGVDELPQLISILTGKMSLIGPRPMPEVEVNVCRARIGQKKWDMRYEIKPGLIPPSLIREKLKGKGYTNPKFRLYADLAYIKKRRAGHAFKEDMRLIWFTAALIATKRIDPQSKIPDPTRSFAQTTARL